MLIALFRRSTVAGLILAGFSTAVSAASVQISVTNNQDADGVYLTPLLSILHDGSFDTFDAGSSASASLEALAEEGNPGLVAADAALAGATTGIIFGPAGFGGAPVLDPGETSSIRLDVDPMTNRFFSFLSMVIPSNDIFIGNDNSMAYEVFDILGAFTGLGPILVYSNDAWDGGTEENDGLGAPFQLGQRSMRAGFLLPRGIPGSAGLVLLAGVDLRLLGDHLRADGAGLSHLQCGGEFASC